MSRFWKIFLGWFVVLIAFFVLANLAGLVRPRGLLPFRYTGFPLTVAAWGFSVKEFFDWSALAVNLGVGVAVSGVVAAVCAWVRSDKFRRSEREDAEQGAADVTINVKPPSM